MLKLPFHQSPITYYNICQFRNLILQTYINMYRINNLSKEVHGSFFSRDEIEELESSGRFSRHLLDVSEPSFFCCYIVQTVNVVNYRIKITQSLDICS